MNNPERVSYNLSETAAAIGVSRKFLYEKILIEPDFPVIKLGKKYIVPIDDLRIWLSKKAGNATETGGCVPLESRRTAV